MWKFLPARTTPGSEEVQEHHPAATFARRERFRASGQRLQTPIGKLGSNRRMMQRIPRDEIGLRADIPDGQYAQRDRSPNAGHPIADRIWRIAGHRFAWG